MKRPKVIFFCNDKLQHINSMEYYQQDIKAFEYLGYEVLVINKFYQIPVTFEILYIWWWTYALIPTIIAKLLNKRVFITGAFNFQEQVGLKYSGFKNRPFYERFLISMAYKFANFNLIISKNEYIQLKKYFKSSNLIYYPHCIADEYFKNNKNTAKENLLVIAWSGKQNLKRKGIFDLINAISILKNKNINVKLTIGGHIGDGFSTLQDLIKQKKLNDCIELLGELTKEKKLFLMSKSLLYLQPSYYEGFGLAAAEALASGCSIITCDVGEVKEVLSDGAQYIIPGNIQMLAESIEKLLLDKDERLRLNNNGYKYLIENFSFLKKVDNLKIILNK
jgi:glycosyltransferase involved in cell wall biosynthesis